MAIVRILAVLLSFFASASLASAETDDELIERMFSVCNGDDAASAKCLKACRGLEKTYGREAAFDRLPNVLSKNCRFAISNAESSSLTKGKACGKGVCIYRLTGSGDAFKGSGYAMTSKLELAGYKIFLRDPKGRVTTFFQCGTCGYHAIDHVKGPLRRAQFAAGSENSIILTLPR